MFILYTSCEQDSIRVVDWKDEKVVAIFSLKGDYQEVSKNFLWHKSFIKTRIMGF